ncbi:MAG: type II secretion system protein [Candidatus Hydrogenedentales bacterium]|jgi:prepilin-type N-terminal cleavage/methylation domain-containing protein
MEPVSRRGFTLIELLTVIAIIAILAGMTAAALPRALERARIARSESDMRNLANALAQYATEQGSFPPAYGYKLWPPAPEVPSATNPYVPQYRHTTYLVDIGLFRSFEQYDRFSENHDSNEDGVISFLEFSPASDNGRDCSVAVNAAYPDSGAYYIPGNVTSVCGDQEVRASKEKRPIAYVPFFSKHLDRMKKQLPAGWMGDIASGAAFGAVNLTFPPPRYDGYVLVSMGPERSTHGIIVVPGPEGNNNDADFVTATGGDVTDRYNILGARAAYLGSRDANANGVLDFDFRARTRNKEGRDEGYLLPDGTAKGGPLLFVYR